MIRISIKSHSMKKWYLNRFKLSSVVIAIKRILITAPMFTSSKLSELRRVFEVTSSTKKTWFTEEELEKIIADYDGVVAGLDPFTGRVIEKADRLRIIARRGIGYDKINLEACKKKGIYVTNTPVQNEHMAVAEFAVGLILDVLRNITMSHNSLRGGSWEREAFIGRDLSSTKVGILGLGHIGSITANLLSLMGVSVIYCDPYVQNKNFQRVDIDRLFKESDLVSIHVSLSPETTGFVDSEKLSLMKKGSYIVNTSRGEVLNDRDIIQYLDNGTLKGVATDVFSEEPPERDVLLSRQNVITTPHIAAFSERSLSTIDDICVANLLNVLLDNQPPKYRVA